MRKMEKVNSSHKKHQTRDKIHKDTLRMEFHLYRPCNLQTTENL